MTDHNQQSSCKYVQVNNPEPVFTVPQDYTPWPFSLKLMVKPMVSLKASVSISHQRCRVGTEYENVNPHFLRRRAMNALLMAMCFYYDPCQIKFCAHSGRLPWSADLQLNLFLAKCPLHEQSGHWNRWKKILNLLPAHRIAIQLLRFFFHP